MADRLTQLQDCLDQVRFHPFYHHFHPTIPLTPIPTNQLATQFYASLRYLSTHHSSSSTLPPSPHVAPFPATDTNPHQRPDTPTTFAAAQRELATDLVEKVQEIEYLTGTLPGLDKSEESQVRRIRELEQELRMVEEERKAAVGERNECLGVLEEVIARVGRVKD
ncbi:MAG: hypothetical protein Q9180_000470 [Flavoplaca navasiana]